MEDGETVILEFQLAKFPQMTDRNLFYSLANLVNQFNAGDKLEDALKKVRRVISIDILAFQIRDSSPDYHQIVAFVY
jgi:hypothetical protein